MDAKDLHLGRAKRGRPSVPPSQRRTERVWVALTPSEKTSVERAATKAGVATVDFIRKAIRETLKK